MGFLKTLLASVAVTVPISTLAKQSVHLPADFQWPGVLGSRTLSAKAAASATASASGGGGVLPLPLPLPLALCSLCTSIAAVYLYTYLSTHAARACFSYKPCSLLLGLGCCPLCFKRLRAAAASCTGPWCRAQATPWDMSGTVLGQLKQFSWLLWSTHITGMFCISMVFENVCALPVYCYLKHQSHWQLHQSLGNLSAASSKSQVL